MTALSVRTCRRRRTVNRGLCLAPLLALAALTGCGTSLLAATSSTAQGSSSTGSGGPTTTVPVNGEVAVAFPVVSCNSPGNGGSPIKSRSGWSPTILLAPVPTSLAGKVAFYTDGTHTVLGPSGWTCSLVTPGSPDQGGNQSSTSTTDGSSGTAVPTASPTSGQNGAIASQGAITLAVYPSNNPNPPTSGPPPAGAEGIFATYATTGSNAGVDLVCPFFTLPDWQTQSAGCSTTKPYGETTDVLTPDVTKVTDPPGLAGSMSGSGGQGAVTGVVLFPQIPSAISNGSSIAVAAESCSLSNSSICPTVLTDFEVREFPVPAAG